MPDGDQITTDARARTGYAMLKPELLFRVNLDRLDMQDPQKCVLGQIYGSYERGLDLLIGTSGWAADEWADEHGFFVATDYDYPDEDAADSEWNAWDAAISDEYRSLTEVWRALITEGRGSDAQ